MNLFIGCMSFRPTFSLAFHNDGKSINTDMRTNMSRSACMGFFELQPIYTVRKVGEGWRFHDVAPDKGLP